MQLYPVKDDLCDKADDREACDHTGDQGAAVVEGDHGCDHRPAHHLHSEPHSRVLRHINVPALQCTAHAAANQPNTSHYKRLQKTVVLKSSNVEKCSSVELRAEFHKSVGSAARGGFPAPASPEDCNTMKYNEIQCNRQKKVQSALYRNASSEPSASSEPLIFGCNDFILSSEMCVL